MKDEDFPENQRALRASARDSLTTQNRYEDGFPGTLVLKAAIPALPMPVGMLWYSFSQPDTCDILNIFTFPPVRRCGVMTRLFRTLFDMAPELVRVQTYGAEPDGAAWLEATGFKKRKNGSWYYDDPERKAAAERA